MHDKWGELHSAISRNDWQTLSEFLWNADAPELEPMRAYILEHIDRNKSHVIIEMFGKVMKRVDFGPIPYDWLRIHFAFRSSNGHTLVCTPDDHVLLFEAVDGTVFIMTTDDQWNVACDMTWLDICGNLSDLEGTPILKADVLISEINTSLNNDSSMPRKWVFYHFATTKGYVSIRWFGKIPTNAGEAYYASAVKLFVFDPTEYDDYEC